MTHLSLLDTSLTRQLGIEVPLICGAMYPCSNPELVAAVSAAGGIGVVQPLSMIYVYGHDFRDGLRLIRRLTDKPIGMNVLIERSSKLYLDRMSRWVDVALEEGVRFFVTSLGNPRWVVERVAPLGGVVYHDVTERKWAEKGLAAGVHGLIAVNDRAGGHAGPLSAARLLDDVRDLGVPVVCAGGVGDAADFVAALKLGYAGAQLGTRFIATTECGAHDDYKQAIVAATESDIVLTERVTGVPLAVIRTPYVERIGTRAGPIARWLLRGRRTKHFMRTVYALRSIWQLKRSSLAGGAREASSKDYWQAGKSVAGITSIEAAGEIVRRFAAAAAHLVLLGALAALGSLWASHARAQGGIARADPCPVRWTYDAPATTSYLSPLFVSDSAGDLFWWEHTGAAELVAVRDGKTRWRRRLSALTRPGGIMVSATLVRDDLLVVSFETTIEGLRTSDGRVVWSRDLAADLPKNTEIATGSAARFGRALVTAVAVGQTGWLVATAPDGKLLWKNRIVGAAARMMADGDRLYILRSEVPSGAPAIIAVDTTGTAVDAPASFADSLAVRGDEIVFDDGYVVTARVHPMSVKCPPGAPCRPPPSVLTVTGMSSGQERWHFSHPVGLTRMHLLLLSDSSVLLIENQRVGRISPDGTLTPLCELAVESPRSVAGLVDGNLVVARFRGMGAYALPGAPQLATTGWVMHGAGPAQRWAVRAPRATRSVPFPAGVADPAADVAYVQTDGGATSALALADGTVQWRTRGPARPVGIWNGRVVVLELEGSALRVAQLDPVTGAEVTTSGPIPIKYWDSPALAPWGEPLWAEVRIDRNRAHVAWEVSINGWSGGAQITPYGASGRADVDLASGVVSLSPTQSLDGPRPIRPPPGPLAATVRGRKFSLVYAATATLVASDAKSGKELWRRRLWSIPVPERVTVPPP